MSAQISDPGESPERRKATITIQRKSETKNHLSCFLVNILTVALSSPWSTFLFPIFIKNFLNSCKRQNSFPALQQQCRPVFGPKRDEVTGEWRKLHNEELNDLYSLPNIVRVVKSRRMVWAGHVARMGEERGVHRVLVGKPEGKRPLGRPRRRWEDNIKMDVQEVGGVRGDWMELAQDRNKWRALVSTLKKLRVPYNAGNFLVSFENWSASQDGLCSME
jgi:hypothetical protein